MALEEELNDALKQALREKDARSANVVRMIKTKITERRTAKDFSGEMDDAAVTAVIAAYRKQLQKALAEYEKLGDRGAGQAVELRFEMAFCDRWLPKGMDEGALRELVRGRVEALGVTDAKQVGRVVGDVMKSHKGQVEAADVKRIAEELLGA